MKKEIIVIIEIIISLREDKYQLSFRIIWKGINA